MHESPRMIRRRLALVVAFLLPSGVGSAAFATPVPVAASASPDPCASAFPSLPNDLPTAFAYDLASPEILHFLSSLAAVPTKERRGVFDGAVAAAASAREQDVVATESGVCSTLDEIYGASRASYLVVNEWQLKEFDDAKRFDDFFSVVATAISALAMPERLTPEQRQIAMLPFARILEDAPSPAPSAGACTQSATPARTRRIVEPIYPPLAASSGTGGTVLVKVLLTETGDVRYVRVVRDTLRRGSGAEDVIRASLYAAAATTYWPETKDCRAAPGAYLFQADFRTK